MHASFHWSSIKVSCWFLKKFPVRVKDIFKLWKTEITTFYSTLFYYLIRNCLVLYVWIMEYPKKLQTLKLKMVSDENRLRSLKSPFELLRGFSFSFRNKGLISGIFPFAWSEYIRWKFLNISWWLERHGGIKHWVYKYFVCQFCLVLGHSVWFESTNYHCKGI